VFDGSLSFTILPSDSKKKPKFYKVEDKAKTDSTWIFTLEYHHSTYHITIIKTSNVYQQIFLETLLFNFLICHLLVYISSLQDQFAPSVVVVLAVAVEVAKRVILGRP
jgi:hypothetical protein